MSEEKPKSPEVKALENEIVNLKEKIENLSALKELLETEKHLREKSEKELDVAYALINKIKKWADGFAANPDADYKGSFIAEEITKVMNKEKKNGKEKSS